MRIHSTATKLFLPRGRCWKSICFLHFELRTRLVNICETLPVIAATIWQRQLWKRPYGTSLQKIRINRFIVYGAERKTRFPVVSVLEFKKIHLRSWIRFGILSVKGTEESKSRS